MKVFFDDLDENYNDIKRFDFEMWFDNSYANKQYVMFGTAERWDRKGDNARGYYNKIFNSLLQAIDEVMISYGDCYLKIYEENYGRLYIDVIHHDGNCIFEVRELTRKGEEMFNNHMDDYDIIKKLVDVGTYTRNVKFSNRY